MLELAKLVLIPIVLIGGIFLFSMLLQPEGRLTKSLREDKKIQILVGTSWVITMFCYASHIFRW